MISWHKSKLLAVVLLVVFMAGIVFSAESVSRPSFAVENSMSSVDRSVVLDSLKESNKIERKVVKELEDEEFVRVIIMLDDDNIGERDSLSRKKKKIKENQQEVLDVVSRKGFKILHQYNTINALAAEVSVEGLKELESLGVVDEVQADFQLYASLEESVPLIGADYVQDVLQYTGEGVGVCVLDTGVDYTHPAIGGSSCSPNVVEEIEDLASPLENSPQPYPLGGVWTGTVVYSTGLISREGYDGISLHFDWVNLEMLYSGDAYDWIEVLNGNGEVVQVIAADPSVIPYQEPPNHCTYLSDIDSSGWTTTILGDSFEVRIVSDDYVSGEYESVCQGFSIDQIKKFSSSFTGDCGDFFGGYDFVGYDYDPMDDQGHGTHVAGIITSDDSTYKGVAPDAGIVGVKVLNSGGSGSSLDWLAGVDWCIANKEKYNIGVISMSLGDGEERTSECDNSFTQYADAFDLAISEGIFISVASGNEGYSGGVNFPACLSASVGVGSVGDGSGGYTADVVSSFTNTHNTLLDLLAPGVLITSTANIVSSDCIDVGGGFMSCGGTSMAAPHVAGLAALMLEADPTLTPDELLATMKSTGANVESWKRIDAAAAVAAVMPSVLSITLEDINFDDTSPDNSDVEDVLITIESSENYEVQSKANQQYFDKDALADTTMAASNLQWSNGATPDPVWTTYEWSSDDTAYTTIASGTSPGDVHTVQHKLDIPSSAGAGTYSLELNFKVVAA